MTDRSRLTTEQRNPRSRGIDRRSARQIVRIINREDRRCAAALAREHGRLAEAIEIVADAFRNGGRLFYVGAGTSGRLGERATVEA